MHSGCNPKHTAMGSDHQCNEPVEPVGLNRTLRPVYCRRAQPVITKKLIRMPK